MVSPRAPRARQRQAAPRRHRSAPPRRSVGLVLPLVLLSLVAAARAQENDAFWLNVGGPGVDGYGPDRSDYLFGATNTRNRGDVAPAGNPVLSTFREGTGGPFGYNIPVRVPGTFTCNLIFAELERAAPGQRVFSARVGAQVIPNVDIIAQVGMFNPLFLTFNNIVANPVIQISLEPVIGNPILSAIQCARMAAVDGKQDSNSIAPVPQSTPPPIVPQSTVVTPSTPVQSTSTLATVTEVSETSSTTTTMATEPHTMTTLALTTSMVSTTTTATSTPTTVPDVLASVDIPPPLEDNQFRQTFPLRLTTVESTPFTASLKQDCVSLLARASGVESKYWALADLTQAKASTTSRVLGLIAARQSTANAKIYDFNMLASLTKDDAGKNQFDRVTQYVTSGKGTQELVNRGYGSVQSLGWSQAPAISNDYTSGKSGSGGSGSRKTGAIVAGAICGLIGLLALVAFVTFAAMRRARANHIDRDLFDSPPPTLRESDVEAQIAGFERNQTGRSVEYIDDDPDSTFTAATSHMGEPREPESGINLDKDVWGRGTGSDY
jgi:hypothetical protein